MINKEQKLKYIKSLKNGSNIPKFQNPWKKLDKKKEDLDDWTKHWKYRTTDLSANSRIVGGWKPGSRNGHAETDTEYTKRRIKEEEERAAKSPLKKAADIAHGIGVGASAIGLAGGLVAAPVLTIGGLAGSIAGEKLVDKGLEKLADATGSNVRSWRDLTSPYLGWSPTLQTLTNPGTLLGGVVGAGAAKLGKVALSNLIRMDMPRFGYAPTTKYYFKPGYLGANSIPIGKYNPDEVVFKPLGITKGTIADFYNKYGHLSKEEMVKQGILKNRPGGQHLVIIDGKPMGSFERVFEPYKNEVYTKPVLIEKQEEVVKPLLTGKEREEQLNAVWNDAAKSIENLKAEHPIPTKQTKQQDVTNLSLKEQIDRLFTTEGRLEQPLTWQELENNPELMKFVEDIYKNGVPINPETGEPIIATIGPDGKLVPTERLASLLAYKIGKNSRAGEHLPHTKNEPFLEGLRGTQPLLERETLLPNGQVTEGGTKVFGDLNFSTDRLLAAINYADVLTHDQLLYVINALRARGFNIPSQSVDYAASLINNIRQMQLPKPGQKGFKLGAHKEEFQTGLRVPRAQFSGAGVGDTDAARRHGIWRSTEEPVESEWADYMNNIVRYNRFFGPQQGNGGVQTVLSRRPRYTWENPFDMEGRRFGETIYYDNGKTYKDIHALEAELGNDLGFHGRDLINGRNPLLMRTIIAPKNSYFYGQGLKKGGKLLKKK